MRKLLIIALLPLLVGAAPTGYHVTGEIKIGGEGGWDYLTADSAGRRLYVSHASHVVVVDLDTNQVVGDIPDTPGVHGIAIAAELNRGFVSNGRSNNVSIVDLKTLQTLSQVDTGRNPDCILFAPGRNEVYAFNGRGQSATVFDAKTGTIVTTIPLEGKPEFAQADAKAGLVFNNLEDKSEVVVIDTKTHTVTNRWPIAPGEEASGMAFDEKNHRLFLGCGNKMMAMMDSTSGKILATVPIGDGVDANAFDPGTQLAFASCGDGTTTIAREEAPDKLTVVQTLETERSARTMTIDPATHKIYLASAKFEAPAQGQRRGRMVPGTFKILVYSMDK